MVIHLVYNINTDFKFLCRNTSDKEHTFLSCSFARADPQFEIHLSKDVQWNQEKSNPQRESSKTVPMLCSGMEMPSQETRCMNIKFTAK
jgi:hypothetical protein